MSSDTQIRSDSGELRLATYGTLAPGKPNAHQLSALNGRWIKGHVLGRLEQQGWGAELGFPGIILGGADPVAVDLFESRDLPDHWSRLEEWEGTDYVRSPVMVETAEGLLAAYIFVLP